MPFTNGIEIIDVNENNVGDKGFFCYMSKKKSEGYKRKMSWLKERFKEGLRIKMLKLPERGFIEYIPGEYSWRPVSCEGYMFIHCLWIVGRSKGKGLGSLLIKQCLKDSMEAGKKGVVFAASKKAGLADSKLFLKHGFKSVDSAPPYFNLLVNKFKEAESPCFIKNEGDFNEYGAGFTVFVTDQCPYSVDAIKLVADTAQLINQEVKVIELKSAKEIRKLSVSPYGTFTILFNGKPLNCHFPTKKELYKQLKLLGMDLP